MWADLTWAKMVLGRVVLHPEDIVDISGVITKKGLVLGAISMHFSVFPLGQCTEWGYFWGLLKFQIFFGYA